MLKSEQVRTIQACAPILGYSRAQLSRWWARYRAGGLEALLAEPAHPGSQGQMTAEAWADLEAAMKQGQIATLGHSLPKCERGLVASSSATR